MIKKVIGIVVVVVLVAGAAFWWFVIRPEPEAELTADCSATATEAEGSVVSSEDLDGEWTPQAGEDTTAGFRIDESFVGGTVDHTAVGRSDAVTGSITIEGTSVSEGEFTVDLTQLEFSDDPPGLSADRRTSAMKNKGLQTEQFPEASFVLTEPIDFGSLPKEGAPVTATATGELTIHGVTQPVTFEVDASIAGGTICVATAEPVPVVLADYEITKPTGGPIAAIDDEGSFEFRLALTQG